MHVMLTQLVHVVLCQPRLLEYYMHLHCALGLSQGAPVVAELCPASVRRIRCYARALQCEISQCKHPDQHSGLLIIQTELVTSPCVPLHIRVPVHDLIFALESLFAAEGRSCPFFFRYNDNSYTDSCLCLIARDQQHSAQNKHPNSANIANSSRVSTAQTGFTAQPCIHAERKLIASSFTVGDERKTHEIHELLGPAVPLPEVCD